jgi:competence protein ComEC
MTLIHLLVAWISGIVLGNWLELPCGIAALAAAILLALLLLWYHRLFWRRTFLLSFVIALGALRWCLAQPSFGPLDVAFYVDTQIDLRGTVVGEAEWNSQGIVFPLQVEELRLSDQNWRRVRGKIQVQEGPFIQVAYGDRLELTGMLVRPRNHRRFSYRDHLARQGIYALLQKSQGITHLVGKGGSIPLQGLHILRTWARERIESLLPEPQASLLMGILLGSRTSMPPEIVEAFSRSGTTHILAISGWNISIVSSFLATAGRRLPRRISLLLILSGIVIYTLLVGASAAVLRSALMGILYVLAQYVGRPGDGLTALAASAGMLTLWNPGVLWDIGFQLSISATLGMFLFVPVWMEACKRWPVFLAESTAATLASQLLTWPLIALYFRQFSLIIPLSNLLACPALTPLILLGALALFLGSVPALGRLLCGLAWIVGSYMLEIVRWTGGIPWASVGLPVLEPLFLILYYGAITWGYYRYVRCSVDLSRPRPHRDGNPTEQEQTQSRPFPGEQNRPSAS